MTKRSWARGWAIFGLAVACACGGSPKPPPVDVDPPVDTPPATPQPPAPVSEIVGPSGATVALTDGAKIAIPADALDADLSLTMAVASEAPPAELQPASPRYEFGPAGTVFARPVKVSFPVTGSVANPTIYWSKADGSGYEPIGASSRTG